MHLIRKRGLNISERELKKQKQILEINATMKTMYKKQVSISIIILVSLRIMI